MGYETNGTEVRIANCPIADGVTDNYKKKGTYYYGAAKNEKLNDLDGNATNANLPSTQYPASTVSNIYEPTKMIAMAAKDNAAFVKNGYGTWVKFLHKPGKPLFPMVFVDGHATEHMMLQGEGYDWKSDKANSVNFG